MRLALLLGRLPAEIRTMTYDDMTMLLMVYNEQQEREALSAGRINHGSIC